MKETNGPKSDLVVFAKKEIEVTKSINSKSNKLNENSNIFSDSDSESESKKKSPMISRTMSKHHFDENKEDNKITKINVKVSRKKKKKNGSKELEILEVIQEEDVTS